MGLMEELKNTRKDLWLEDSPKKREKIMMISRHPLFPLLLVKDRHFTRWM